MPHSRADLGQSALFGSNCKMVIFHTNTDCLIEEKESNIGVKKFLNPATETRKKMLKNETT